MHHGGVFFVFIFDNGSRIGKDYIAVQRLVIVNAKVVVSVAVGKF